MTNPLFVANLDTLKSELRLSGVYDTTEDVQVIIERAVLRINLEITRRLGASLVSDLQAISYSANPTTDDQRRRALANLLEIEMVKCVLLRELPTLFSDSSGKIREDWNTDAVLRSQGPKPCDEQFIEDAVAVLTNDEARLNMHTFTTRPGAHPWLQPRLRSDLLRRHRHRHHGDCL